MAAEEHYRKPEHMYAGAPVNGWYGPVLTDGDGRQLARVSGSFLRSSVALGADLGYA